MLFPALAALGGAFFLFVLRVQGADGCFPRPLSAEEEAKLLKKMREEGDTSARNLLIEHNLRLVSHIIKKYYSPEAERDDLVSIGTIGLMSGLAYWNDWTNGLYYLVKRTDLYSIQNVLTNMLNNIQFLKTATQLQGINIEMGTLPSVSIRMAIAVVAVIPVMIVYPFIQKSFVKGIVIGGVKG